MTQKRIIEIIREYMSDDKEQLYTTGETIHVGVNKGYTLTLSQLNAIANKFAEEGAPVTELSIHSARGICFDFFPSESNE